MRIACVMMQKDETILFDPWFFYHADLLGPENLFIFDNGSKSTSVIQSLQRARSNGANVIWEYSSRHEYRERGPLIANFIQQLDHSNPFDFYFLLDCDEFLACQTDSGISCQRRDIERVLQPYIGSRDVLLIRHKFWHNPCRMHLYSVTNCSPKCFFAQGACGSLDHGYHHAKSRLGSGEATTNIIYFEFHYKPYGLHRVSSRQHLSCVLTDFSRRSLRAYQNKRDFNHHCAEDLLEGKFDYVRRFLNPEGWEMVPALLAEFNRIGISYARLYEPRSLFPQPLQLFLLRIRQSVMHRVDGLNDLLYRGARFIFRRTSRLLQRSLQLLWRVTRFDG
ncbi:hypothetical protein KBY82_04490 [Cyanobium sp. AMD-g]|uniref:hypothetical protein n=1 Tax=Cyanobium sp. AMD-g TaxID=2823699 RepID=UPI0020CE34E0|nr:hypothetical protein [Cyanobium sp. AMD-g]MCP9930039.1 hypothetical protein [Cyanobium sp. AMD-g]